MNQAPKHQPVKIPRWVVVTIMISFVIFMAASVTYRIVTHGFQ